MLEHDADLDASQSDRAGVLESKLAEDFATSLETLCAGVREGRFSQWLHPPADARVALIRRFVEVPTEATAFRRRLTLVATAIFLLYGLAGIVAVAL
jgi:hypothetical protein